MTIYPARIFLKLIIVLCMCTCIQAALNFVPDQPAQKDPGQSAPFAVATSTAANPNKQLTTLAGDPANIGNTAAISPTPSLLPPPITKPAPTNVVPTSEAQKQAPTPAAPTAPATPVKPAPTPAAAPITAAPAPQSTPAKAAPASAPAPKPTAPTHTPTPPPAAPKAAVATPAAPTVPAHTVATAPTPRPEAPEHADAEEKMVEFYFEDADLQNLLNEMASLYKVTFITDDIITPLPGGGRSIKGNKISFKTNKPLSPKAAWDLFLTFLEIAGFSLTKETKPNMYRVVTLDAAKKSPLPTFIGVKSDKLPKNEQMIRYVYFVQNTSVETLDPIIQALRSNVSGYLLLKDMQAFMLTDKAYNIVSLMEVVNELDKVTMPQSMSVLKLKRADALDVKKLYDELAQTKDDKGVAARLFPARKQSTAVYFPENLRLIAYPRTNTLILLGSDEAIKKIENFISTYVDVDITAPYPPIRVHNLKFAEATDIAKIMNDMMAFGEKTEAGKSGGVRGGDKYFKKMIFTPEPTTNRLIVQGDEADYLAVKEILDKLDEQQPQVALDILILGITINENEQLGAQIRSKAPGGTDGLLGNTVKFQTSGLFGEYDVQTNAQTSPPTAASTGANRLLANLINLAVGAPTGNTLISLGSDLYGVWGLLQALQSITNTQIIANPFLVATNKTPAKVEIGQTRRVVTAQVVATDGPQNSYADRPANLKVGVTPQINSDGMIVLKLDITVDTFADPTNFSDPTINTKTLSTNTIVANGEVLALGGLIQNQITNAETETPILGKIPILGWLFKNKASSIAKANLLILICPRILPPDSDAEAIKFTNNRILGYHTTLAEMLIPSDHRDPVNRFFFEPGRKSASDALDNYLFERHEEPAKRMRKPKEVLQRNQQARKRSPRRSRTNDSDIQVVTSDVRTVPHNEPQSQDILPLAQDNIQEIPSAEAQDNADAPPSTRSPRRARRSLATLIADSESPTNDSNSKGVIS